MPKAREAQAEYITAKPAPKAKPKPGTKPSAATKPGPQYIVDSRGRKTAVILSIEEYERLLEDIHDLALMAEASSEPPLPIEEVEERLIRDGVLPPRR